MIAVASLLSLLPAAAIAITGAALTGAALTGAALTSAITDVLLVIFIRGFSVFWMLLLARGKVVHHRVRDGFWWRSHVFLHER